MSAITRWLSTLVLLSLVHIHIVNSINTNRSIRNNNVNKCYTEQIYTALIDINNDQPCYFNITNNNSFNSNNNFDSNSNNNITIKCSNLNNAVQSFKDAMNIYLNKYFNSDSNKPVDFYTVGDQSSFQYIDYNFIDCMRLNKLDLQMVNYNYPAEGNVNINYYGLNVLIEVASSKYTYNRSYTIDMSGQPTLVNVHISDKFNPPFVYTSVQFKDATIVNAVVKKQDTFPGDSQGDRTALVNVRAMNTDISISNCYVHRPEVSQLQSDIFYFESPYLAANDETITYNLNLTDFKIVGATGRGNLLSSMEGLSLKMKRTEFIGNIFMKGFQHYKGKALIESSSFDNNRGTQQFFLEFRNSSVDIIDTKFTNNVLDMSNLLKAIITLRDCKLSRISGSYFSKNDFLSQIAAVNTSIHLSGNTFEDNNYANYGSAIFVKPSIEEYTFNVVQARNKLEQYQQRLPLQYNDQQEKDSQQENQQQENNQQQQQKEDEYTQLPINGDVIITNTTFRGNSASFGGVLYSNGINSVMFENCTFNDNSAGFSGYSIYTKNVTQLSVFNSSFTHSSKDSRPITCFHGGSLQFHNTSINNQPYSNSFSCSRLGCNIYSNTDTECTSTASSPNHSISNITFVLLILIFIIL